MKIVKKILLKIVIFTAVKNRCMLHGRVFVMCVIIGFCGQFYQFLSKKIFALMFLCVT